MPQLLATSPDFLSSGASPLAQAREQNEAVKETVEQSAAELLLINAVLEHELPLQVKKGDVAQALKKADELQTRIDESAADLAEVNDLLLQEADARADLEQELADTKAALTRAESRPAN